MADSSEIDNALVTKLGADATLLALMPNGAYFEAAPPGATRFVIVSLVDELDVPMFGSRAYEDALYSVEAFGRSTDQVALGATVMQDAFARINVLLENQPLVVTGYTRMALHRESRWRKIERDEVDSSILWHRRGGNFRVVMSL